MDASPSLISRRWFLRALALIPALPAFSFVRSASAQTSSGGSKPAVPPAAPAAPAAPEISPDVQHLTAILLRRYGKVLTPEQAASMAPDLNRVVAVGERLRKVTLTNADEPDFVFYAANKGAK